MRSAACGFRRPKPRSAIRWALRVPSRRPFPFSRWAEAKCRRRRGWTIRTRLRHCATFATEASPHRCAPRCRRPLGLEARTAHCCSARRGFPTIDPRLSRRALWWSPLRFLWALWVVWQTPTTRLCWRAPAHRRSTRAIRWSAWTPVARAASTRRPPSRRSAPRRCCRVVVDPVHRLGSWWARRSATWTVQCISCNVCSSADRAS